MARYLVISPNGYGNAGDDICAYGGKAALEAVDPSAEVVISQPPMQKNLVKWADFVVLSGGGILYDRAPDNVNNYMQYIDYAHRLGKKSAVLGVGYQGIVTDEGKKRYKESLAKAEFVSLRTQEDKDLLDRDLGLRNTHASFDIAFSVPRIIGDIDQNFIQKLRGKALATKLKASGKIKVGMSILDLKKMKKDNYGGTFKAFDEALESFLQNRDKNVEVYFMQHAKEDGTLQKRLAKQYGGTFVSYKDIHDIPTLWEVYENIDLLIGVRLHSIALGLMAKKAVVGIGSANAKQRRLSEFNLPTLKKQFVPLGDKAEIEKFFKNLLDPDFIHSLSPLSEKEYAFIEKQTRVDVELLKKMINS